MHERLVGRERELRIIEDFVDRLRGGPAALIVEGEAGIGKSALWAAGVEVARTRNYTILSYRAVEAEAQLSFTAVADLLDPVIDEVLESVRAPRRRALAVALLLEEPGFNPLDQRMIGAALVDALAHLSMTEPVLLAIDDGQWLDISSVRALQFALRRVGSARIGWFETRRANLESPLPGVTVEWLSVGPLTPSAVHRLLSDELGLNLTRHEVIRIAAATGGNPLFALEVGRELIARVDRLPSDPLPVPPSFQQLVGDRVRRLPRATREALLTVATAGRPTVEMVTAIHGPSAHALLEEARDADVISFDGSRVRFVHPLLAEACYEDAPIWERRTAHRRLAALASDSEERARHLALASDAPDEAVATAAAEAAEYAAERGRTAAAAELLELAAALTPAPAGSVTRARKLRAARLHRLAGERAQAGTILDELLPNVEGEERSDVLVELARVRRGSVSSSVELCEQALGLTRDPARAADAFAFLSFLRVLAGDVYGALDAARAGLQRAELVGDPELLARAIGRVASAEQFALEMTPGLLERGVELERTLTHPLGYPESPTVAFARRLSLLGKLTEARELMLEEERRAEAVGDEGTRGQLLFYLSMVEWHAGRWSMGLAHCSDALELAEQGGDAQFRAMVLYARAALLGRLGDVEETRSLAAEVSALAEAADDATFPVWTASVLGSLELSLGNPTAAAAYLVPLPEKLIGQGWNEPADPWPEAIEVLVTIDEVDKAGSMLATFDSLARRLGAPHALGASLRCRALVEGARGDVDAALGSYEAALELYSRSEHRFELARTLLLSGTTRRRARQKRAARDVLERAHALFDELGAPLWIARTDDELRRIAGRRLSATGLTKAEEQVVELVVRGCSNKEIAATLFITVHTVEGHLTRIYRKFGVRSRTELIARSRAGVDGPKL